MGGDRAKGYELMAQDWRFSSAKARRELGYRSRPLDETLRTTIDWYMHLINNRAFENTRRSSLSTLAGATQTAGKLRLLGPVRLGQRLVGRQVIAGV